MKTLLDFAVMAAFSALLFVGCVTPSPIPTPTVYDCGTYCAHAIPMGCDFAQPTPGKKATCVEVCQNVQDKLVRWNLECRSTAPTCSAIDSCEREQFYSAKPVTRAP